MISKTVSPDTLNDVMEFDHVITVNPDGTVSNGPAGIYAPEVHYPAESDLIPNGLTADQEMTGYLQRQGWELLTGYTGQYAYRGPVMHASEFIGGRIARDILAEPGVYVALTVEEWPEGADESEPVGWAVARRITE